MTNTEKRALIESFLNDELSLDQVKSFKELLEKDADLRGIFRLELELVKSLDPEGDYQHFKAKLNKAQNEFFGDRDDR